MSGYGKVSGANLTIHMVEMMNRLGMASAMDCFNALSSLVATLSEEDMYADCADREP